MQFMLILYDWTNKFDKKKVYVYKCMCVRSKVFCTLDSPGLGLAFGAS